MNDLEHDKNRQDQQQTPLFIALIIGDLEHQRRADFLRLLNSWAQIAATSPAAYGPDVPTTVGAAKAALDRGLTPYHVLLVTVGSAFLGHDDRELEVIEIDPEPEDG